MANALITNARMYAVAPGAVDAWKRLFAWLGEETGLELAVIDHAFPARLDELWRRPDLACTFMCGWPYLRHGATHKLVAAPIPAAEWARGRPVYCSHFIVRADSLFTRLEDTFGHRFAYTIEDSHSGYNAPRHHLLRFRGPEGRPLFREVVGPLTTPRRVLEAIADSRADVGPQDSFAFALMSHHLPELARQVRIIASTEPVPIPAFIASRDARPEVVEALAAALCSVGARPALASLRDELCIAGFARLDPAAYAITETWAREAEARGLATIA
jgi:ABC-type phosphate/phosphonate transport system substrate-binding protein